MNYSMYLCVAMATVRTSEDSGSTPADTRLDDVTQAAVLRVQQLIHDFTSKPVSPQALFDFERQVQAELRELGRASVEWALNHIEPGQGDQLPPHLEFEAGVYTRIKRKTPQDVATLFGKVRLRRYGYRPTQKTGDATIFPLAEQLGMWRGRRQRWRSGRPIIRRRRVRRRSARCSD
jgi:transposase